ncbi:MAG: tyrosine--tRNA ligase [Pseudomonadota bacterium]|nr:tyrosine--tRNA ligase [Pseudomonadota bacterium]MEC8621025.1 tyrosine--tRNA ligase [Pseudomonadota bacterium]
MSTQAFIDELRWRGLLTQVSDERGLLEYLDSGCQSLYCGFDPTADSLHVGSLVPLLALRRFQLQGHRPLLLLGGATGMIGDPSGRDDERSLNAGETISNWIQALRVQVSGFLEFDTEDGNSAKIVNNLDWTHDLPVIDFLRDIGKHFSVNSMIQRDSVKSRLERANEGISYTEFSYMLLQAMDFLRLAQNEGCLLQIGGSDQWGNIVSGIDLIRRHTGESAFAFTMPLVTKADGTKFGKSAAGAVWIDPKKTSPYAFYQFWLNTADADVVKFLKLFTFLTQDEIENLEVEIQDRPELRQAQKKLAREVTTIVHGEQAVVAADRISTALFAGDAGQLLESDLEELQQDGMPCTSCAAGVGLLTAMVEAGLTKSAGEARKLVQANGIKLNGDSIDDVGRDLTFEDALFKRFYLLRKGKKNYHLIARSR